MTPLYRRDGLDATQLHRLHDAALAHAADLREQAVDDFWRGVDSALWAQLATARRAATRLAQRLQRHQRLRAAAGPTR